MKICVVIPMYNEEAGAEKCVCALRDIMDINPYLHSLIVVNDGSNDSTGKILGRLVNEHPNLIILNHKINSGYGSAIRTGMKKAINDGYDYAIFMDSDLTNDPKYLPLFIQKMEEGYDLIKASRYIEGGGQVGVPRWKVIISVVGNRIASFLYGLPLIDCTNGFRAFKVELMKKMNLSEPGFPIIMEELYHVKNLTKSFCDIPYVLSSRAEGEGKSKFSYGLKTYYQYLKYPIKSFVQSLRASPAKDQKTLASLDSRSK